MLNHKNYNPIPEGFTKVPPGIPPKMLPLLIAENKQWIFLYANDTKNPGDYYIFAWDKISPCYNAFEQRRII